MPSFVGAWRRISPPCSALSCTALEEVADWLGYSLADFLPFSRGAWLRLYELYNARFWPGVLLGLAIGIVALRLLPEIGRRRAVLPGVSLAWGLCWLWVAWAFQLQTYAQLNWIGGYFALAFALQGLLLVASGIWARLRTPNRTQRQADTKDRTGQASRSDQIGSGIVWFAVLGLPLIGLLQGRDWQGLALFGSAPEPTAMATLGLAAMLRGRLPPPLIGALMVIPAGWCLIDAATLAAMGDALWPLPLVAASMAIYATIAASPPDPAARGRLG